MTSDEINTYFRILVRCALVDGPISPKQANRLEQSAYKIGMSPESPTENGPTVLSKSDYRRKSLLKDVIRLVRADGNVTATQWQFVVGVASMLNLKDEPCMTDLGREVGADGYRTLGYYLRRTADLTVAVWKLLWPLLLIAAALVLGWLVVGDIPDCRNARPGQRCFR